VDALLIGTGGASGWPEPGCSCASCLRARSAGTSRAAGQVLVDGSLTLRPGQAPEPAGPIAPHQVRAVPGGWDITGPDGGRLLAAAGPGQVPEPPDGTRPFDLALLDLLASPAQLGRLRAAGLVQPHTSVAALYTDHRVTSAAELARRCELWGATAGRDGQLIAGPDPAAAHASPVRPHRTLIVGGARSGKSREAELRLAGEPAVTYLAAGPWADETWAGADGEPDAEWAARVAAHQKARPSWWRTEETLDLAGALRREAGAVLIDGMGTWLAAIMDQAGAWPDQAGAWPDQAGQPGGGRLGSGQRTGGTGPPEAIVAARIDELISAWRQTRALVVAVTDQVGSGLVPPYPAGRAFRDELGWLNQRLAAESDLSLLTVAGRILTLPA
jgi:adenosylcobinamide kinase/adenosylcobinamide-phosphate guanylyltransferase